MTETFVASADRPEAATAGPASRVAFTRYVSEVLGGLGALGELRTEGRPQPVDGFRLRSHRTEQPVHPLSSPSYELAAGAERTPLTTLLSALLRMSVPKCGDRTCWSAGWKSEAVDEGGHWALPEPEDSPDFVFGYPVPPVSQDLGLVSGKAELAASVLAVLLDAIDIVAGDHTVRIDEIEVDGRKASVPEVDPGTLPSLGARQELPGSGLQPLHTVAATEPTILVVARHWSLIAELVTVRKQASGIMLPMADDGVEPTRIAGFVLRDLSEWLVESECHPAEIYEYLARVCNVACQFCYLFGNPDDLAVARGKKVIAEDEISTRLRYFRPDQGLTLFKSQWEINEFLVDPKLPHVLRHLRAQSDQEFYFITNGSPLLPRVIDLLDEVRPVTLIVSTNTIDAPLRQKVMNERRKQTETALDCLQRLSERQLPFGLSFIATPDFPVEQLANALRKIEPLRPAMVRVNLPGFTRDHPYKIPFDIDELWERVTREIAALRREFSTPIVIIPSAYEANLLFDDPHEARVSGTVPGSPAAAAGFEPGDVVERIGALPISSRSQALSLAMVLTGPTPVVVCRRGRSVELTLDPTSPTSFPYTGHVIGKYVVPQGLVASPSLGHGDARVIKQAVESTGAQRPWLATSPLMYRQARSFTERLVPDYPLHHVAVRNEYLGGNIQVMDMATVSDIYRSIQGEIECTGARPDLLLVPGTGFNREGRDIAGRHWDDLSRALRIPVRLLDDTTQFLF